MAEVEAERLVIKRFGRERPMCEYAPLLRHTAALGAAPAFVDAIPAADGWFGVFRYVPGRNPAHLARGRAGVWDRIPGLLERIGESSVVPSFDVCDYWRRTLTEFRFPDGPGRELQRRLMSTKPAQSSDRLAHGDFIPQNFVWSRGRLVVVDWEQAGRAPWGFDAGWAIAVVRSGSLLTRDARAVVHSLRHCAPDEVTLRWFVRLGLLRMLWRAHTLPVTDVERVLMMVHLRELITDELADRA